MFKNYFCQQSIIIKGLIMCSSKTELTDNVIQSPHLRVEKHDIQKGHEKSTDRSQMFWLPVKYIFCYTYCNFTNHQFS